MPLLYKSPDTLKLIETLKDAKVGDANPLHHYQQLNRLGYLLEYLWNKVEELELAKEDKR